MKNLNQILLTMLAVGLSAWTMHAQNAGVMAQRGGRQASPRGGGGIGSVRGASLSTLPLPVASAAPIPRDDAERKALDVLEDMLKADARTGLGVPRDDGRLVRLLTESIGAKNVVELGTVHGYSSIWISLALRSTGGRLTTFEGDTNCVAVARQNFQRAGVNSLITLVEGDPRQQLSRLKDPVDLVLIDTDKGSYQDYFNQLLPLVRPGGLIVARNMDARQADPDFTRAIGTNASVDALYMAVGPSSLGVTLKKR